MPEKEITIKISTEAEIGDVEDLKTLLEEIQQLTNVEVGVDDTEIVGASESIDELASGADEASSSTDELSSSIDGVDGSNVQSTAGDFDDLGTNADNADQEVQELQGNLDMLNAGAMMGISNELSSLGGQAEGMAQEMNTAAISVGQLSTQAGIAEPQMVGLINNISNATFPQSEAMQYVTVLDQLGVSAGNLGNAATDMDRINDAFGIGSDKVVSLTGNLYAMGVPADQLSSSYNALGYAQSNVAGGVDQFSKVLARLGPSFSEYNLNVDQAAVITAAASQKWGTGRKAMSNLSSALKDANGDTRALEQALGLQEGALDNASATTGEYEGQVQNLADEEREHKTIVDELGAAWEDMSLSLSPVLSPLASVMGLIGQAGSFAVGINGIVTLAQSMRTLELASIAQSIATKASAAAQWLLNIAMDANPIMIVVLAIIALVAILAYLYFNNEQVRQAIDALGQTFMWIGQVAYASIVNAINIISTTLMNFWNYIVGLGTALITQVTQTVTMVINGVLRFITWFTSLPGRVAAILTNTVNRAISFATNFAQKLINAAVGAVNGFASYIGQLPGKLKGELDAMLQMASTFIMDIANMLTGGAAGMVVGWITGSGESSPGYMYDAFYGELTEMDTIAQNYSKTIPTTISTMGSNMVKEFGEPTLGFNVGNMDVAGVGPTGDSDNSKSQTINLNVEVGSVDSEDRVREIVDVIRRELSWDNTTAGRTI